MTSLFLLHFTLEPSPVLLTDEGGQGDRPSLNKASIIRLSLIIGHTTRMAPQPSTTVESGMLSL